MVLKVVGKVYICVSVKEYVREWVFYNVYVRVYLGVCMITNYVFIYVIYI